MTGVLRRGNVCQHLLGDNLLLDLAGAFVDAQRAHVAVEPLDDLAPRHPPASEELHGTVANAAGRFGGEPLRHRRFPGDACRTGVFRPRRAIHQERGGVGVGRHAGDGGLRQLQRCQRRAEQFSGAHVREGFVERAARESDGGRADRAAEDVEHRHRDFESSAFFTDPLRRGNANAVEPQRPQRMRRDRLDSLRNAKPGARGLHDERGQAARAAAPVRANTT